MTLALLSLILVAFAISWLVTLAMKHVAPRLGFVDKPGHRKIHHNPKPLGGGVGIVAGFILPIIAGLVVMWLLAKPLSPPPGATSHEVERAQTLNAYLSGAKQQTPLAVAVVAGALVLHLMGLRDDRRALGPYSKLAVQLAVTIAIVARFDDLRILTALGPAISIAATVLWIVAITNAFNFLDNMDGLSAGVAAVCTTAFLVATLSIEQWFVAAALALLLGALLGFLCFNFAPATIFMGDAGSLVVGFLLGVLTVRTTFLPPDADFGAGWYAVAAPLIVLAVPLYDLVVVSIIRLRNGKSPFVGDTNHFSHRLVARGMSRRTAVLCIYLVTAATSAAAIVLPHVRSGYLAAMIVGQTVLILGVVALLEQHPLPDKNEG
jgi:UDP-GlcNAc:undecaprenyl-phosphate GlcNAc-1-phosphate transferase